MTKDQVITAFKACQDNEDFEMGHAVADESLCLFLCSLGYEDVVTEFCKVRRLYA